MKRNSAFSLAEMVVVMGIIALLASIAVPIVIRSLGAAEKTRIAATLNTISTALNAYRQDFGRYPQVLDYRNLTSNGAGNTAIDNGAYTLVTALLGPGPESEDGQDGMGFRARRMGGTWTGKIYSPYIAPGAIPITDAVGTVTTARAFMVKSTNTPILYYPVSRRPDIATAGAFVADAAYGAFPPMVNYRDNQKAFTTGSTGTISDANAIARLQYFLGDTVGTGTTTAYGNGAITAASGEKSRITGDFILWSSGVDRDFGPDFVIGDVVAKKKKAMVACDDIVTGLN